MSNPGSVSCDQPGVSCSWQGPGVPNNLDQIYTIIHSAVYTLPLHLITKYCMFGILRLTFIFPLCIVEKTMYSRLPTASISTSLSLYSVLLYLCIAISPVLSVSGAAIFCYIYYYLCTAHLLLVPTHTILAPVQQFRRLTSHS